MVAPPRVPALVVTPTVDRRERERGPDLGAGTSLAALGLYVAAQAVTMPRPAGWHSAPGLLPFLLGSWLTAMSAVLLVGSVKRGGGAQLRRAVRQIRQDVTVRADRVWRMAFMLAGVAVYVYLLLPRLYFEIATFVYLATTMRVLWRREPLKIALVAGGVAVALTLLFSRFLRTLLPGAGSWL